MSSPKPKAKTLADAKRLHDPDTVIRTKIESRFAEMLKIHPEEWDYEIDFIRGAGISQKNASDYREHYKKHIAVTEKISGERSGKTLWFADPRVAAKFRGDAK